MHPSQKEVSSENRDNSTNGGTPSRNLANIEWNEPNNDPRGVSSGHVHIPTDGGIISRYYVDIGSTLTDNDPPFRNNRVTERTQRGNNAQRGVSLDRGYFALLKNNTHGQVSSGNRDRSSGGGTDPPSRNYDIFPWNNPQRRVSSGNRDSSFGGNRDSSSGGGTDPPPRNYAVLPRTPPQSNAERHSRTPVRNRVQTSGVRRTFKRKRPLVESSSDSESEMPYPEESMRAPKRSFKRNRSRFSSDFWLPRR
nr:uncharacterized protein LOC108004634 [Drosophila suzukii]